MANLPVNVKPKEAQKKPAESTSERITITPAVDIFESKDEMVMLVDMPGVAREDAQVKVDNGIITISGEARTPAGGDLRYWEFSPCLFNRAFELGAEVDQEKIEADYKNGILTVHLPKREKAKARQIQINVK
ncbi:Hsp20/alpha crystallin family protein [bacterium]|nr:Hsp20/alpha crystallin family protein [bacterium]